MKVTRLFSGAVLMLLVFCLAGSELLAEQQAQQENSAVKLSTDLVSLNVSVIDRNGNAALDLKKEDFRIFENGVEQSLSFFSTDEAPVSWGLVLDRSGSMQRMIRDVYQAALHVMDEGTDDDEMFVATFNKRVDLVADFTKNRRALQNSVAGLRADGNTALYDAIAFGLDRMRLGSHQKKVLVVVTDGEDNSSRISFKNLVERAKEAGVLIYTIGMFESMNAALRPDGSNSRSGFRRTFGSGGWQHGRFAAAEFSRGELKKLAEVSGAVAHFPASLVECKEAMATIAAEVSRQYSIGYYPTNAARDSKWRKIQVKVSVPGRKTTYMARARAGYYAPQGGDSKPE